MLTNPLKILNSLLQTSPTFEKSDNTFEKFDKTFETLEPTCSKFVAFRKKKKGNSTETPKKTNIVNGETDISKSEKRKEAKATPNVKEEAPKQQLKMKIGATSLEINDDYTKAIEEENIKQVEENSTHNEKCIATNKKKDEKILKQIEKAHNLLADKKSESKVSNEQIKGVESKVTSLNQDISIERKANDVSEALTEHKQNNKSKPAVYVKDFTGVDLNLPSMFGHESKQIHENKRQMLIYVITIYDRIKQDPNTSFMPETLMIGGKAAPGYHMDRQTIKHFYRVRSAVRAFRLRGISDTFSGQFKVKESTRENWLAVAHNHVPDPRHGICSKVDRTTHCDDWMTQSLMLDQGGPIQMESATIPIATAIKFQPQSVDFFDLTDPKAVLEMRLRHFTYLSTGHMIEINYNNKIYEPSVLRIKPAKAASIVEYDMFGDKAAPGSHIAKQIIKLFNRVGSLINKIPVDRDKLRVVFIEN